MAEKLDYKKAYKDLYLPKKEPVLIEVPPILYLMVDGVGAPEQESYQESVSILYALAFTIKMSKMGGPLLPGYFEYDMPPLEGLWNCDSHGNYDPDRTKWQWTSLLRQPDFVTEDVFRWAVEQVRTKKPELNVDRARLETYDEKLCVQVMHIGPYSKESESIKKIAGFVEQNGLIDRCGPERRHHEIYISDPRKSKPENLKTVLRHPVERIA